MVKIASWILMFLFMHVRKPSPIWLLYDTQRKKIISSNSMSNFTLVYKSVSDNQFSTHVCADCSVSKKKRYRIHNNAINGFCLRFYSIINNYCCMPAYNYVRQVFQCLLLLGLGSASKKRGCVITTLSKCKSRGGNKRRNKRK